MPQLSVDRRGAHRVGAVEISYRTAREDSSTPALDSVVQPNLCTVQGQSARLETLVGLGGGKNLVSRVSAMMSAC